MPRIVKPEFPSRPAPDRAAEKRAGLVGTLTPGSNRIRSLMSVARAFSISSAVMRLTLAGTSSTRRWVRVPTTVTGARTAAPSGSLGVSAKVGNAADAKAVAPAEILRNERMIQPRLNRAAQFLRTIIRINRN